MNAISSRKLLALFALVVSAAGTGCAAADTDQGPDDVPEIATGEMTTRLKGALALGQGSAPNACPAGKEQFYDHCYAPCPADYPVAHITMCFKECSPGYMISPGNCEVTGSWVPNPLGSGGSFTKQHYPVASVDRGAGTRLVCADGMTESNGRCYGTAKPTPSGGSGAAPSAPAGGNGGVDAQADACNHKPSHTWVPELRECLSTQEHNDYLLGQLGKNPKSPEEPSEPLPCEVTLSCPGKLWEPADPGFLPMPKLGCMDHDDPFCFDN